MVKIAKKITPILLTLIALLSVFFCKPETKAFASSQKFMEYTRAMVYHSSGGIYLASQYKFSNEKKTFETENGPITVCYQEIIPKMIALANSANIAFVYDESTPNVVIIIEKYYPSRTDMNHDLGITGDEIEEPMPKEEGFWFTTYLTDSTSYLAYGGKDALKSNWSIYAKLMFGIDSLTFDDVGFNYVYGTEYENIKTNGNVYYDKLNGMYYHSFYDIDENTVISMRQTVPNTKNWYSVLIGASVGVLGIGLIVAIIVKKKSGGTNGENREETKSNAV